MKRSLIFAANLRRLRNVRSEIRAFECRRSGSARYQPAVAGSLPATSVARGSTCHPSISASCRDEQAPAEAGCSPEIRAQSAGTVKWIAQFLARCQLFAALPPKMPTRSENAFHLFLNPREQRHRFADNMSIRQAAPLRIIETKSLFFPAQLHLPIQLIENSMRRLWQHWRNQNRNDPQ